MFILFSHNYNCKTTTTNLEIDSETKIRYIEMYESICCPRDYKHDNHLINYIKSFEYTNNVSLNSNFKLPLGREGEAAYFLSLENLSLELQVKFINERLITLKTNDKSILNHLKNPISINQALKSWENISIINLIKI